MGVRVTPQARATDPTGRGIRLKSGMFRVRISGRTPDSSALSSEAEHLFYTQGVGISKFSGRTMDADPAGDGARLISGYCGVQLSGHLPITDP